jgi:hypothetical protein
VSLCIPSSSQSSDHDPHRTIYYLGYPLGRFAGLKHRQLARQVGVIITTGRIRRAFICKINLPQRDYAYAVHLDAPSRRSTSHRSVALALAVRPVTTSHGGTIRRPDCTGSTTPMPCIRTRRLAARHLVGRLHWLSSCVRSLRLAARLPSSGLHRLYCVYVVHPDAPSQRLTSRQSVALALTVCPVIPLCVVTTILRPQRIYFAYAARLGASARRSTHHDYFASRSLVVDYFTYATRLVASARRAACHVTHRRLLHLAQARHRLLCLHRASRCLGTSRSSSHDSSSTTSTTPRVRVPRHVARLITRLVEPLVIDYFTYAARPVASARRAACRVTHGRLLRLVQARRRLLRLHRASRCLGTSRGSSRDSLSITSTTPRVRVPWHVARLITRLVVPLVIDYFVYAARPVPRHVVRLITRLVALLVVDYVTYAMRPGALARRAARRAARRRLLRLRRASGCLGMSCGLSHDSSSTTSPHAGSSLTTSPTPRVRVPRPVARLVKRLVVDYFATRRLVVDYFTYAACPVASAHRAACRVTHRRLLRLA